MVKSKQKTILLVDADVLCFKAAAAAEKRTVIVKHLKSGEEKEFQTRTEFRKSLQERFGEDWKSKETRYSCSDVQTAESLSAPLNTVKARLHLLKKAIKPDSLELVLGGVGNFRDSLPLPSKYKGAREGAVRPVYLSEVRDYVRTVHKAKVIDDIEADDWLSIRAYEELAKGNKPIIGSVDKDTYQAEGIYVYDWTAENPELILVPEIGELRDEGSKGIKGLGLKFFAFQLLYGDSVDCYWPSEITNLRYGQKSAFKDLNGLMTADAVLAKVVEKYKEWYPAEVKYTAWNGQEVNTDWRGMLDMYFKCAYMLRSQGDTTTWKEFFNERGWNESI